MPFTDEQRAKAAATRKRNRALKEQIASGAHVEIADTSGASPRERKLLDEINELRKQLGLANEARSDAETAAITAASDPFNDIEEKPTGKKVKVQRLDHYKEVGFKDDGRPILKPVFKTVELPTYAYRINMPPVGGTDLKINEVPFYHGATYVLDVDTLRTVKDMVWKLWAHDRNIHGTDENAYRKPTHRAFSGRGYA